MPESTVDFAPHPLLKNAHLMTFAAALLPRRFPALPPANERLFDTEPKTQLLALCNWQPQPRECPTLVLVHGLEGSSASKYMRGAAEKAFLRDFNVLRVNQRTCGRTEALTPTLYNSGLSGDFRAILEELTERDKLPALFFAGFSMGGNLVFKMAGELGASAPAPLLGICGICPSLDLAACVAAIALPRNAMYERNFVGSLKARLRRKARLSPGAYRLEGLDRVRTVREFDEAFTAPDGGYRSAADYYQRASAVRVADRIAVPALIVTSRDDPFIPAEIFSAQAISVNPRIRMLLPRYGGHCGFISRYRGWERYWAEARIVEFCGRLAAQAGLFAGSEVTRSDRR